MKITVIGSHLCPDTLYALNRLSAAGAEVDFQDILSCHAALRTYLNLRDTNDLYAEIRGTQRLLIHCPALSAVAAIQSYHGLKILKGYGCRGQIEVTHYGFF